MVRFQQPTGGPPATAPIATAPGLLESIGFGALVFFVFAVASSVIDMIPGVRSIRPSLLAAVVGLSVTGITGQMLRTLKHKIALAFIALTIWFFICVPFSVWPGGAVQTLAGPWLVAFLTLFMVGGLMQQSAQCRKIANTISYSAMILAGIALARNEQSIENRLMLGNSRYGNPNELALMGLTALPFLAVMAMRRGNGLRRLLGIAGFFPILLMIAKTASRAAMIGAVVALLTAFWYAGLGQKVNLLVLAMLGIGVLTFVLPEHITRRFLTIFGETDRPVQVDELSVATIESAQSRRMLLLDSIAITFQRPIFGVGTGNFPVEQDKLARLRGESIGNWHLTHNTYTQISSESGLPGLLFLLMAIFFCFRSLTRTRRAGAHSDLPELRDLGALALALRISLMAYLTCAFFDSLAYSPTLTLYTGLAISLEYCVFNHPAMLRPSTMPLAFGPVPVPSGGVTGGFTLTPQMRPPARQNPRLASSTKSRN